MSRFAAVAPLALAALVLTATAGAAARFECAAPGLSLDVDVNPPAGTCAVDGRRVALRKAHDPVVCHITSPQLRILTILSDLDFVYEDTGAGEIHRGTCRRV